MADDFATKETVLTFGKYKGKRVSELIPRAASYLLWADRNISFFKLEPTLRRKLQEHIIASSETPFYPSDPGEF